MLHKLKISKLNIKLSYFKFNIYCFKLPIIAIESCSIKSDPEQSTPAKKLLVAIKQISSSVGDKTTPVFLSYQSAFKERVLQLKRALEERDIPCWMANEDLVGNMQDAIGEALMAAPAIIICYSHSYRESMYEKNML